MPINPSYQNQPIFANPYGGASAPSIYSGPSGGYGLSGTYNPNLTMANWMRSSKGGGWLGNALGAGMSGGAMGGPLGAAIGVGGSLLTGLLGGLLSGDDKEKELLKMSQAEAARVRKQRKQEMEAGQSAYQRQAASLFPEMPQDAFTYRNPTLDNVITNALMYRLGNLYSDWGMPQDRRQGGQDLRQQFLGGMNFANPYGAPPQQIAPQPDVTVSPGRPERGGGWMGDFQGQQRPRRGRRGENDRLAM